MNSKRRSRISLIIFTLCLFLFSFGVSAATPAKVGTLKASTLGTTIRLSWASVKNAAKYEVYREGKTTGKITKLGTTTRTLVRIKNCSYNQKYYFKVRAIGKNNEIGPFSNLRKVELKKSKPGTPKNFTFMYSGDHAASFKWSTVSGASGYAIEVYDSSTKTYEQKKVINSSSTRKVNVTNLPLGELKIRIRSFKKVDGIYVFSDPSNVLTVTLKEQPEVISGIRAPYYVVKTVRATKVLNTKTKQTSTVAAGTKLYVTSKYGTVVEGFMKDAKTPIKVRRADLKYTGLDSTTKNDYSKTAKETFVNYKQFKSSTKYLIWVSEKKFKVNIFYGSQGKWKLMKAFDCCIGKWETRTANGFHKILYVDSVGDYGGPIIYFSTGGAASYETPKGCSFHGKPDSRLNKAISHGCIRMNLSDLSYIYNNCGVGTTVYVY